MMNNSIEIYRSQDGSIQLNVKLENDTVWLTQSQMAELFGVDRTSIVRHIRNIYKSEELDQNSTCAKNAQVRTEGHRSILREIPYYNLDMIISVGYRVNSKNATSFCSWATSVLKQYQLAGFQSQQVFEGPDNFVNADMATQYQLDFFCRGGLGRSLYLCR